MLFRMILLAQETVTFDIPAEAVAFQHGGDAAAVGVAFILFFLFWMFICLALLVALTIIPLWLICKKAGVSPYISLLILVPGVNCAFYWILALIDWPNLKKDDRISQPLFPPSQRGMPMQDDGRLGGDR